GEIARIGVSLQATARALFVGPNQVLAGHVDFAADLDQLGRLGVAQAVGQTPNGTEIVGDVVATLAVAAGGAEAEFRLLVREADGDAVDLELDHVLDAVAAEQPAHPAIELAELVGI